MGTQLTNKPIKIAIGIEESEWPTVHYLDSWSTTFNGQIVFGHIKKDSQNKEFLSIYEMSLEDFSIQNEERYLKITPYDFKNELGEIGSKVITPTGKRFIEALRVLEQI